MGRELFHHGQVRFARSRAVGCSSVASNVAAARISRLRRPTSPCSVTLMAPSSVPYGWARIASWVGPPPGRWCRPGRGRAAAARRAWRRRRAAPAGRGGSTTGGGDAGLLVGVRVAEHHLLDVAAGPTRRGTAEPRAARRAGRRRRPARRPSPAAARSRSEPRPLCTSTRPASRASTTAASTSSMPWVIETMYDSMSRAEPVLRLADRREHVERLRPPLGQPGVRAGQGPPAWPAPGRSRSVRAGPVQRGVVSTSPTRRVELGQHRVVGVGVLANVHCGQVQAERRDRPDRRGQAPGRRRAARRCGPARRASARGRRSARPCRGSPARAGAACPAPGGRGCWRAWPRCSAP